MKKIILFALILLAPIAGIAKAQNTGSEITRLATSFRSNTGFEVMKISGMMLKLSRMFADSDDRELMQATKNIESIWVVDYDDASIAAQYEFDSKASEILAKANLIMESKDDNDIVYIYGQVDDSSVRDLIIYIPSEANLVYLQGSINLKDLGLVVEEYN